MGRARAAAAARLLRHRRQLRLLRHKAAAAANRRTRYPRAYPDVRHGVEPFTWFDVLTSNGDLSFDSADAVASLRETSDAMLPLLHRLHQRHGYALRNIFILGYSIYSQGGTWAEFEGARGVSTAAQHDRAIVIIKDKVEDKVEVRWCRQDTRRAF